VFFVNSIFLVDAQKSIDEILTASQNSEMQPLLQPTSIESTDSANFQETHESYPIRFYEVAVSENADVEDPVCDVDVIVIDADSADLESLDVEPPEAFTIPKEVEVEMGGAVGGVADVPEAPLVVEIDDQGKD
jgi:hypothetical protein